MADKNLLRNPYYLLGRRIQHVRIKRGYTQERLAEEIKISLTHLGNIETGKSKPSLDVIFKIARVFDLKVEELFKF